MDKMISNREKKREETLKKLLDAMHIIMEKYDYDTLTIRNICSVSGVSYGSFYNLFDSKEKFLTYYLTHDFVDFKMKYYENNDAFYSMGGVEKAIDIFVSCAAYNVEKGLSFVSGFYSPKNCDLSPYNKGKNFYCFTPLVQEGLEHLKMAQKEGTLPQDTDLEEIIEEFCYIFNASTFNWCTAQGKFDIVADVRKRLNRYIQYVRISEKQVSCMQ